MYASSCCGWWCHSTIPRLDRTPTLAYPVLRDGSPNPHRSALFRQCPHGRTGPLPPSPTRRLRDWLPHSSLVSNVQTPPTMAPDRGENRGGWNPSLWLAVPSLILRAGSWGPLGKEAPDSAVSPPARRGWNHSGSGDETRMKSNSVCIDPLHTKYRQHNMACSSIMAEPPGGEPVA